MSRDPTATYFVRVTIKVRRPTGPRLHALRRRETRCICTPPPSCRAVVEEPSRCKGPGVRLAPPRASGRSRRRVAVVRSVRCTSTCCRAATAPAAAPSPFADGSGIRGPARAQPAPPVHTAGGCIGVRRCARSGVRRGESAVHSVGGRAQPAPPVHTADGVHRHAQVCTGGATTWRTGRARVHPAGPERTVSSSASSGRRPSGSRSSAPCSAAAPTA